MAMFGWFDGEPWALYAARNEATVADVPWLLGQEARRAARAIRIAVRNIFKRRAAEAKSESVATEREVEG